MQSQVNPLASSIIKLCLPDGLAVPFPENVRTGDTFLFIVLAFTDFAFLFVRDPDFRSHGNNWC